MTDIKKDARKRTLLGTVVSDKMQKTIVVKVERTYTHTLLNKVMRTTKKYKVHDEHGQAHMGDMVEICEGRPVSKDKHYYLVGIVKAASAAGVK